MHASMYPHARTSQKKTFGVLLCHSFALFPWVGGLSLNLELGWQSERPSKSSFLPVLTVLGLLVHVKPYWAFDMGARNSNSASHACTVGEHAHWAISITSNHSLLFHRFILPNLTNAVTQQGVLCIWTLLSNEFLLYPSLICIDIYCWLVFIAQMELNFIFVLLENGVVCSSWLFWVSFPKHSFTGRCYRNVFYLSELSTHEWNDWIVVHIQLWKPANTSWWDSITLCSHDVLHCRQCKEDQLTNILAKVYWCEKL